MPAATKYSPPTEPERQALSSQATLELDRRRTQYKTALKYYLGNQDEQLKQVDPNDPNDNTYINVVQMTADRTVSFIFPDVPHFETDPESVEDTPEELYLKKCFEKSGGLIFLTKLALRGFLSGHAFVRVMPPKKRKKYPEMVLLDPTTVSVFWRGDEVGKVLWYEQRYVAGGDFYIQDFIVNENEDGWMVRTFKSNFANSVALDGYPTNHGNTYTPINILDFTQLAFEEVGSPQMHTSEIAPIIEFRHLPHPDDYYGLGEFTQKDLQDTINRIVSERTRIVRETSDPVDIITGADVDDVNGDGGIITVANANARVNRLEMKGDLAGITSVLEKLIETYLAIARVVLLKGEAKDLQRVTNASVRTLFLDALSKNSLLQSSYGAGLGQVSKLLLMMGYANGLIDANPQDIEVLTHFGSPLPVDQTELANINALGLSGGYMSEYTAAINLNLDPKFEKIHRDEEMAKNLENQGKQMEMAAKFATPPLAKGDNSQQKPDANTQ